MTLTKAALIHHIYNSKDLSKAGSAKMFDFLLEIMKKAIKSGEKETPR
jgi:nucleoid DNA-binding protein